MKPARLRPLAHLDQQNQVRYYRQEAGSRVALRLVAASHAALDQIEQEPRIGSRALGSLLDIPELRTWRIPKFPLLWLYFERRNHVDVIRLLGERQDIARLLGEVLDDNS